MPPSGQTSPPSSTKAARPATPRSTAPPASVANALIAEGVRTAGRVAHLDKSSDLFFELLFGAAKANAVMVSVNWRLAPPEVLHIVNDAEAEILFVGEEFFPVIEKIRGELKTVRKIVALGGRHADWEPFAAWRDRQPATDPLAARSTRRHGGAVLYQRHDRPAQGRRAHQRQLRLDAAAVDPELAAGAGRAQPRLPADVPYRRRRLGHRRPVRRRHQPRRARVRAAADPRRLVERERLQVMLLVPAMILFLVQAPQIRETDLSSLRLIVYGAAPIPAELLKQAMSDLPLRLPAGLRPHRDDRRDHPAAARDHDPERPEEAAVLRLRAGGRRAAHRRRRRQGPAPPARSARSRCARRRSWAATGSCRDATARAIQDDWFFTGDAGYLDDEGYLYIYDRVKDMIVSGGENIYPAEVESALFGHPAVADVAVIGVPDERWGEAVKAVVVLKPGAEVDAGELIAWARERIAGYKLPKSVDFIEALPRNPPARSCSASCASPTGATAAPGELKRKPAARLRSAGCRRSVVPVAPPAAASARAARGWSRPSWPDARCQPCVPVARRAGARRAGPVVPVRTGWLPCPCRSSPVRSAVVRRRACQPPLPQLCEPLLGRAGAVPVVPVPVAAVLVPIGVEPAAFAVLHAVDAVASPASRPSGRAVCFVASRCVVAVVPGRLPPSWSRPLPRSGFAVVVASPDAPRPGGRRPIPAIVSPRSAIAVRAPRHEPRRGPGQPSLRPSVWPQLWPRSQDCWLIVALLVDLAALAIGHAIDTSTLLRRDMAVGHGARLGAIDLRSPCSRRCCLATGDLTVADAALDPVLLGVLALIDVVHRLRVCAACGEHTAAVSTA